MKDKKEIARLVKEHIQVNGPAMEEIVVGVFDRKITLRELYDACFKNAKGERALRLSPPRVEGRVEYDARYYVWRNLVFYASPKGQHHCMPVMADCVGRDYPFRGTDEEKATVRRLDREDLVVLDAVVDLFLNTIPVHHRYGLNRWARAMYGKDISEETTGIPGDPLDQMLRGVAALVTCEERESQDDPTLVPGF